MALWVSCTVCRFFENGDCEGTDHDKYRGCLQRLNTMCIDCGRRKNRECVGTDNLTYSGCIYRREASA